MWLVQVCSGKLCMMPVETGLSEAVDWRRNRGMFPSLVVFTKQWQAATDHSNGNDIMIFSEVSLSSLGTL